MRLILFILLINFFFAGGKKTTIYTYRTEGWVETDYLGSGYHFVLDKIRPNIWIKVRKVDGEINDWVGLPNNVSAGDSVDWTGLTYDRLNPYSRLSTDEIASFDPSLGKCRNDGRCYGDWVNQDELWQDNIFSYKDNAGVPFLTLKDEMHGEKKTRYRFEVFVEDNQPYWLKDENGQYESATTKLYYPLSKVTFRLTDYLNPSGVATTPPANDDQTNQDEFYIQKSGEDFLIENSPIERRLRSGKFVFNFSLYHTFQKEKDYFIMVTAEDIEGNRRTLRVPITMKALSGITLNDKSSGSIRN